MVLRAAREEPCRYGGRIVCKATVSLFYVVTRTRDEAHTPNRQTRKQARSLSLSLLECSREAFQSQTSSRLPLCTAVLYCETPRRD